MVAGRPTASCASCLCIHSQHVHSLPWRVAPMSAVRYELNGGLSTCLRFIMYQEYLVIVHKCFFINPIWYFYLIWLNKLCLSLSLVRNHYMYYYLSRVKMMHYLPRQFLGLFSRIKNEFSRHRKPKQPLEQIMCTFYNTRVTLNVEVHWKWSYHEYKSFRCCVW